MTFCWVEHNTRYRNYRNQTCLRFYWEEHTKYRNYEHKNKAHTMFSNEALLASSAKTKIFLINNTTQYKTHIKKLCPTLPHLAKPTCRHLERQHSEHQSGQKPHTQNQHHNHLHKHQKGRKKMKKENKVKPVLTPSTLIKPSTTLLRRGWPKSTRTSTFGPSNRTLPLGFSIAITFFFKSVDYSNTLQTITQLLNS